MANKGRKVVKPYHCGTSAAIRRALSHHSVSEDALLELWRESSPYCVEAIKADQPSYFSFIDQCIFFAAITPLPSQTALDTAEEKDRSEDIASIHANLARLAAITFPTLPSQTALDTAEEKDRSEDTASIQANLARLALDEGRTPTENDNHVDADPGPHISSLINHTSPYSVSRDDLWSEPPPSGEGWWIESQNLAGASSCTFEDQTTRYPRDIFDHRREPMPRGAGSPTLGFVFSVPTDMPGEVSIGIALRKPWRRRGFATRALTLFLPIIFEELGYHRAQALLLDAPELSAARTLFISLGFTIEGTHRRALMTPALPGWRNVTYLGMLDTEWVMRPRGGAQDKMAALWDEMFARQQHEREQLLQLEARRQAPRKTASMETIRDKDAAISSEADAVAALFSGILGDGRSEVASCCSSADPFASPPSSPKSTYSWSNAESGSELSAPNSPLLKGKGKARESMPSDLAGVSGEEYASDSGSGWDMI
ncbi:predicted protein [Postia placenta Mad-698-R]|uniref:N-acetyltransferase domain-containing protein n=1 Tax=Postia placenta MAD-698-R-SB12 TaxID=670580 RepID=A0A1X6N0D4_9APHY|nr:hypothetical protein POSPLADRAFT_1046456 [Postia placenta MAD-698-R-SB12]EED82696.1 predicted protein [Postia placenta Mad-698-R]OSX61962.1 hypothetical protein POSPLADRAFT_1046456 [Postia placenta MAD-698-R-SB12]